MRCDDHTYNRLESDAPELSRLAEATIGANRFEESDLCKKDLQDEFVNKLLQSERGCFCQSFSLKAEEGEWVNIKRADGSICVGEIDELLHSISAKPPTKQTPSRKGRRNRNAADEDDGDHDVQQVIYIANLI